MVVKNEELSSNSMFANLLCTSTQEKSLPSFNFGSNSSTVGMGYFGTSMALLIVWMGSMHTRMLPSGFSLETLLEIHAVGSVTFFRIPCFSRSRIASDALASFTTGHRYG